MPDTPAISNFVIGILGRDSRNHFPAIKPRIIVPSVGMKLSVRYPPELYSKRFSRGNKFRNHWSKRFPKLQFLFQCAANPVKLCSAFHVAGTPTRCQSKFAGAAGYAAHKTQYPTRTTPSAAHTHFARPASDEKNPSRNKNGYPNPICESVSSNVKYVMEWSIERRNTPSATNTSERHNACQNNSLKRAPFAMRLAIEYGSATPTRKENPG